MRTSATNANILRLLRSDQHHYQSVRSAPLQPGLDGIEQTIRRMQAVVARAKTSQMVQQVATAIVGSQPNRNVPAQLLALDQFLRACVRFKPDTLGAEVLRAPDQLLHEIGVNGITGADCDDVAVLGASIAQSLGRRPYFVVCSKRVGGPWIHVHYAVQAVTGAKPIPFDPQERMRPGEWTTPPDRRRVYPAVVED